MGKQAGVRVGAVRGAGRVDVFHVARGGVAGVCLRACAHTRLVRVADGGPRVALYTPYLVQDAACGLLTATAVVAETIVKRSESLPMSVLAAGREAG